MNKAKNKKKNDVNVTWNKFVKQITDDVNFIKLYRKY